MSIVHLSDDDLVLHYYGEMAAPEEARAAAHLAECHACQQDYGKLQRLLALVGERVDDAAGVVTVDPGERDVALHRGDRGQPLGLALDALGLVAIAPALELLAAGELLHHADPADRHEVVPDRERVGTRDGQVVDAHPKDGIGTASRGDRELTRCAHRGVGSVDLRRVGQGAALCLREREAGGRRRHGGKDKHCRAERGIQPGGKRNHPGAPGRASRHANETRDAERARPRGARPAGSTQMRRTENRMAGGGSGGDSRRASSATCRRGAATSSTRSGMRSVTCGREGDVPESVAAWAP